MRVVAYVDAMYRPTDKQSGYGFLVEEIQGNIAVPILMGNKRLPYSKQGSAQTEIMAIEDFENTFAKTLIESPDCIYTDSQGILSHLTHLCIPVSWVSRESEKIQMAHSMAQRLKHAPEDIFAIPS